jgi:DNA-directed RNA polymerase specialized sigma subunit
LKIVTTMKPHTKEEEGKLSIDDANELVLEHQGWAESIARSVARAWNMDWQLDGLDGAAMEALIFCARRYQPNRGVPFKGYARRRIHEASTEAARKSKGWQRSLAAMDSAERRARDISADLFQVFPELRSGELPSSGDDQGDMRGAVRQLLVGAALLSARESEEQATPEELMDYKRMIKIVSTMEEVHQLLVWKVYWEGISLRKVATEWETDGLNVIREHKVILLYLHKSLAVGRGVLTRPKIRPGLRPVASALKKKGVKSPFGKL